MRLLMLNNEYPPLGGGTGTVNQALLQRFARMPEMEIDLITSEPGREPGPNIRGGGPPWPPVGEQLAERVRLYKVPVDNRNIHHSTNAELLRYASAALRLACARQRARPYDLCLAFSAVPAGGVALALRLLTGLPYLLRVCGPDIPGFERRYAGAYRVLTPAIRAAWHGARAVVAKCEGEAEMIRRVDRAVGVTLVPNGVDLEQFRPGAPVPDGGPLKLICVGRLIERKGQAYLIQAVRRLVDDGVDVALELVGTGDAQAMYEAQARDWGVARRVRFAGYVPRSDIPAHYAAAHAFVLPSYNEGMSVATLEAMAAGLPVVATRTGGTAELIAEGVNGWTFDRGDVTALTGCLRRLALDRGLARGMGAASRERARKFSWEAAAEQYLAMFDAAAGPRPTRVREGGVSFKPRTA